jgi:hypothetical protein
MLLLSRDNFKYSVLSHVGMDIVKILRVATSATVVGGALLGPFSKSPSVHPAYAADNNVALVVGEYNSLTDVLAEQILSSMYLQTSSEQPTTETIARLVRQEVATHGGKVPVIDTIDKVIVDLTPYNLGHVDITSPTLDQGGFPVAFQIASNILLRTTARAMTGKNHYNGWLSTTQGLRDGTIESSLTSNDLNSVFQTWMGTSDYQNFYKVFQGDNATWWNNHLHSTRDPTLKALAYAVAQSPPNLAKPFVGIMQQENIVNFPDLSSPLIGMAGVKVNGDQLEIISFPGAAYFFENTVVSYTYGSHNYNVVDILSGKLLGSLPDLWYLGYDSRQSYRNGLFNFAGTDQPWVLTRNASGEFGSEHGVYVPTWNLPAGTSMQIVAKDGTIEDIVLDTDIQIPVPGLTTFYAPVTFGPAQTTRLVLPEESGLPFTFIEGGLPNYDRLVVDVTTPRNTQTSDSQSQTTSQRNMLENVPELARQVITDQNFIDLIKMYAGSFQVTDTQGNVLPLRITQGIGNPNSLYAPFYHMKKGDRYPLTMLIQKNFLPQAEANAYGLSAVKVHEGIDVSIVPGDPNYYVYFNPPSNSVELAHTKLYFKGFEWALGPTAIEIVLGRNLVVEGDKFTISIGHGVYPQMPHPFDPAIHNTPSSEEIESMLSELEAQVNGSSEPIHIYSMANLGQSTGPHFHINAQLVFPQVDPYAGPYRVHFHPLLFFGDPETGLSNAQLLEQLISSSDIASESSALEGLATVPQPTTPAVMPTQPYVPPTADAAQEPQPTPQPTVNPEIAGHPTLTIPSLPGPLQGVQPTPQPTQPAPEPTPIPYIASTPHAPTQVAPTQVAPTQAQPVPSFAQLYPIDITNVVVYTPNGGAERTNFGRSLQSEVIRRIGGFDNLGEYAIDDHHIEKQIYNWVIQDIVNKGLVYNADGSKISNLDGLTQAGTSVYVDANALDAIVNKHSGYQGELQQRAAAYAPPPPQPTAMPTPPAQQPLQDKITYLDAGGSRRITGYEPFFNVGQADIYDNEARLESSLDLRFTEQHLRYFANDPYDMVFASEDGYTFRLPVNNNHSNGVLVIEVAGGDFTEVWKKTYDSLSNSLSALEFAEKRPYIPIEVNTKLEIAGRGTTVRVYYQHEDLVEGIDFYNLVFRK